MARPREYPERANTAVRFDKDLHARLVAEATARDLSVNWLVNKAVAYYLDRLIPVDEMKWTRDDT